MNLISLCKFVMNNFYYLLSRAEMLQFQSVPYIGTSLGFKFVLFAKITRDDTTR